MRHGCGRFSDEEWAELISAEGSVTGSRLGVHIEACPECRTELRDLLRFGLHVRGALSDQASLKESFVNAVLAEVNQSDPTSEPANERRSERVGPRWLPARPMTWAAAGVLAILIVFVGGLLPWEPHRDASTGYTVPGGRILSLSESTTEPLAAALTPRGVAVAVAASDASISQAETELRSARSTPSQRTTAAQPIHTSRGITQASTMVGGS